MSKKYPSRFVSIPNELFVEANRFSSTEFRTLVALMSFTTDRRDDPRGWWTCYPSISTLALCTASNPSTVQRVIRSLKKKGLVVTKQGVTFNSKTGLYREPTNLYDLGPLVESLRQNDPVNKRNKELTKDMTADEKYRFYRDVARTQKKNAIENSRLLKSDFLEDLEFKS